MDESNYTRIIIQKCRPASYYNEQETAEYTHLEVQVIRRLQAVGLITGIDVIGEERRYSEDEVARVRRINRLRRDLGVNLAGAEVILRLCAQVEALQRELDRYRENDKR